MDARAVVGYNVPSLPVGSVLDTDGDIVQIIGLNGAGKTTLLKKIEHQLCWEGTVIGSGHYADIEYIGEKPRPMYISPSDQPHSMIGARSTGGEKWYEKKKIEQARMSEGQYAWDFLAVHVFEPHAGVDVLLLDNPEKPLDAIAKRVLVQCLEQTVANHGVQLIIAPHDEIFMKAWPNAKLINLSPVEGNVPECCLVKDFDFERYFRKHAEKYLPQKST